MKKIHFRIDGIKAIDDLFRQGITGYSTKALPGGAVAVFWLYFSEGSIVGVCPFMTTIRDDSWDEVGSLEFKYLNEDEAKLRNDLLSLKIPLSAEWLRIVEIDSLIYVDDEIEVQCGFAIKNSSNQKLVVLSAAFPETIAISAPFYAGDFDPEFNADEYKIIQQKRGQRHLI